MDLTIDLIFGELPPRIPELDIPLIGEIYLEHVKEVLRVFPMVYAQYLNEFKHLVESTQGEVLDIACGAGGFLETIAKETNYSRFVGVDKSKGAIEFAKKQTRNSKIEYFEMDANRLGAEFENLSTITCVDALHHFDLGDNSILPKIHDVLSDDGTFFFHDLNREYLMIQAFHAGEMIRTNVYENFYELMQGGDAEKIVNRINSKLHDNPTRSKAMWTTVMSHIAAYTPNEIRMHLQDAGFKEIDVRETYGGKSYYGVAKKF